MTGRPAQTGSGILEVLVASAIALMIAIALYDFFDHGNRSYQRESELAASQNAGRVAVEVLTDELRTAGYSPLGLPFWAIPRGDGTRVKLLADINGDGVILSGVGGDEDVTYVFDGPNGQGEYELRRGLDLNADWDFADSGESSSAVASRLVAIDFNDDGTAEPFLAYSTVNPPATPTAYDPRNPAATRVTVTFGVRSEHRDRMARERLVVSFQATVALRNRE